MKKSITIYQRLKFLYLCPNVFTVHGVGIESGACIKLCVAETAATELGEAVLESLERSGAVVPHPEDWENVPPSPVLAAAGVKSWSTFSKKAKCLEVYLRDDELLLTPTQYEGRQFYAHLNDQKLQLPSAVTATELGEAILQTLSLCR